jgi:plastocyanin
MKKLVATGAAAALAAGALAAPTLGAGTRKVVSVKDNKFVSSSITVRKGTTVKWVWKGHAPHNVTVTKGPAKFHSSTKVKGSFSKKLTRKGTYTILCTIHAPGMEMKIKVK